MLRTTLGLTLATVAGLVLGFAREWLLVAAWGAGARTDAFLVAMFVPEAVRMTLASGLLAAAAMPLLAAQHGTARGRWLTSQWWSLLLLGVALAAGLAGGAPWWVRVVGPGLGNEGWQVAADSLVLLAAVLPALLLHALAAAVGQARGRFLLAGLGSLVYNLPAVLLLAMRGATVDERTLAWGFVVGGWLMLASAVPLLCAGGWRPWQGRLSVEQALALYHRLGALLASASASQGLALLERICASWLGEGAITVVNLARKLVNLPLVALGSLNQVLLARMVGQADPAGRRHTLRQGLLLTAALTVPAALGLVAAAPVLVGWMLPPGLVDGPLPELLAWFACVIVFGGWNALLARHAYAGGDTLTPLRCELAGNAVTAVGLVLLPLAAGMPGIAWATLAGCVVTATLLLRHARLLDDAMVRWLPGLTALGLGTAALLQVTTAGVVQLLLASAHAGAWLLALGLWTRRQSGLYSSA